MMSKGKLVFFIVFLGVTGILSVLFRRPAAHWFAEQNADQEAVAGLNLFLGGLNRSSMGELSPQLPQNQYMPSFLLEKLQWLAEHKQRKLLIIRAWHGDVDKNGIIFDMGITPKGETAELLVGRKFLVRCRKLYASKDARVRRGVRSMIALRLAHEVLHLESAGKFSDEVEEEMSLRISVIDNAALPLAEKGELLPSDDLRTIEILANCNSAQMTCEAYRDLISRMYSTEIHGRR